MKSIEELKENAQSKFPHAYITGAYSAVCLFGATTNGRTDLIHLYDSGLKDVVVVDGNKSKLDHVATIFPDYWSYVNQQCLEYCGYRIKHFSATDLIVADGSKSTVDNLWEALLPVALSVARNWLIFRVSGEFLEEYEVEASPSGIFKMCQRLHGLDVICVDVIKRSSNSKGIFWVVIQGSGNDAATQKTAEIYLSKTTTTGCAEVKHTYGGKHTINLYDLLGQHGCPEKDKCCQVINLVRKAIYEHERTGVYRFFTSERFAKLPSKRIDNFVNALAIFEVNKFKKMDEVWEAARLTTKKKGRVIRDYNRAKRNGYFVKKFDRRTYIPDIYSINVSKPQRAGKQMRADYRRTVQELGGYPDKYYKYTPPTCPVHGSTMYGVFKSEPGRFIGDVCTNDRLVGYIHFFRCGNLARYSQILGHGDHLAEGIMYLLHFTIVEDLLLSNLHGLYYLMYSGFSSRGDDGGLQKWKRRCLFEPKFGIYDEVPDWLTVKGMKYLSPSSHSINF